MDLSVVIPLYNSSKTIIESLDSVVRECNGTPCDWEVIVVNDGSQDNSGELVRQYITSRNDNRVVLIEQPNSGASVARNAGLTAAKGTFIAFNDSDDRWLEGKLSLQLTYFTTHPDVVMIGAIYDTNTMNTLKRIDKEATITIHDQMFKNYFSPPTVMLRASILSETGLFNPKIRNAEEGYFFNNIVYHGRSVLLTAKVAEPIIPKKKWGDSGLSGQILKMEQGELYYIWAAYSFHYISLSCYIIASIFSIMKFMRRAIITLYRRLC